MQREYNGISIRSAKKEDAPQLCSWWNDGAVMAHAGFPDGVGTTVSEVEAQLIRESDETGRAQHVYERLGFQKVRMNVNAWEDARGVMQTSIDYALTRRDFIPFLK